MTHPRDLIKLAVYGIQRYSVALPAVDPVESLLASPSAAVEQYRRLPEDAHQRDQDSAVEPLAQEIQLVTPDGLSAALELQEINDKRYPLWSGHETPRLPCEAGLTSVVYDSTAFAREHMPQVDFRNRVLPDQSPRDVISKQLTWVLQTHGWLLFDSGNSYHLYCPKARLSLQEWLEWMGRLLLVSQRLQRSAPDALRPDEGWIARSLVRGHSCLRWTGNYKPAPFLIAE